MMEPRREAWPESIGIVVGRGVSPPASSVLAVFATSGACEGGAGRGLKAAAAAAAEDEGTSLSGTSVTLNRDAVGVEGGFSTTGSLVMVDCEEADFGGDAIVGFLFESLSCDWSAWDG